MSPALSQLPAKQAPWPDTDAAAAKAGADAAVAGEDVADGGGDAAGGGGEVSRGLGWAVGVGVQDWAVWESLHHFSYLSRMLPSPPLIHHKV